MSTVDNNICHLIPFDHHEETIYTMYFVYEKNFAILPQNQTLAFYKLCLVTSGKGTLRIYESEFHLKKGDVFFIFPSVPHSILTDGDNEPLKCIYISFFGTRANRILAKYHIRSTEPVYSGYEMLIDFWEQSLALSRKNTINLMSESVLLYTLAVLGMREEEEEQSSGNNLLNNIKKYIDENYNNPMLSLNKVCALYHYNPKYISSMFKKYFSVGFNDYLNSVRIHEACKLIGDNLTSVKDIAARCGFRDQYYFSRVFKNHTGLSPRSYISEHKAAKSENNP